jgi:hypothetical protein
MGAAEQGGAHALNDCCYSVWTNLTVALMTADP